MCFELAGTLEQLAEWGTWLARAAQDGGKAEPGLRSPPRPRPAGGRAWTAGWRARGADWSLAATPRSPALSLALLQPRGARAPDRSASVAEAPRNACLAGELEGLQAEQAPGTAPGPCLGLFVFCLKGSLLPSLFFSLPRSYARGHTQSLH